MILFYLIPQLNVLGEVNSEPHCSCSSSQIYYKRKIIIIPMQLSYQERIAFVSLQG